MNQQYLYESNLIAEEAKAYNIDSKSFGCVFVYLFCLCVYLARQLPQKAYD